MKALIPILILLSGCTAIQQKSEAYRETSERFIYPDKLRVCYQRDGDVKRGFEARCFGEGCELPECP